MNSLFVKKKSNEIEEFDKNKFKKSLTLSGVESADCDDIIDCLEPQICEGTSTREIHKLTKKALEKKSRILAANYHLVRGIYELGPTGYPFEILCAQMLEKKGFETEVGVVMQGEFVTHEVDVVAKREDFNLLCECKFHNKNSGTSDVKVALYINSRFHDILGHHGKDSYDSYAIITNTSFSKDAIAYAEGVGLKLFSLNYPVKDTFTDHIIRYRLYPITCLKTLRKMDIQFLLGKGIVVIKQLKENIHLLEERKVAPKKINEIQREINLLIKA